jgi:hypothetical protein
VKRQFAIQIRRSSWAIAALILIAFSLLGFAAVSTRSLYEGLEVHLAFATWFGVTCGPVAFPILGVVAATAIVLSDVLVRYRWVRMILIILFSFLAIWAFEGLFGAIWGATGETMVAKPWISFIDCPANGSPSCSSCLNFLPF